MKQLQQNRMWTFYRALVSVLIMFLLGGCSHLSNTPDTKVIGEGTKVNDLDLSGTLVSDAPAKIDGWAKDKLEETRVLLYNEKEILMSLRKMDIEVDPLATNQGIQERFEMFSKPAKDAAYKIEKDKVVIELSENGRAL